MLGTIVFAGLFAVLTARLWTKAQRTAAEEARMLPLEDAERDGGRR
jgi:cbb3-type cytochrome oxidase subunit 3